MGKKRFRSLRAVDRYQCPGCLEIIHNSLQVYVDHTDNCEKYQAIHGKRKENNEQNNKIMNKEPSK